jgi:hypothetical protein
MKNIFNYILILIVAFSFESCDETEELFDQDFTVNIDEKIPVHVDQTTVEKTLSIAFAPREFQGSVDLSIDTENTHEYLNKIKSVEVKSLTYKFIEFNGDPTGTVNASLYINNQLLGTNEVNVKTEADNGTIFSVSNPDELTKIANSLRSGYKVTARYQGTAICNQNEMNFRIQVMMRVMIVANPL